MNIYIWGIIIGGILLLVIAVWILIRMIKKRRLKKAQSQIPIEVINDFNEAEKEMKGGIQNGTNPNPYQILWNIARRKQTPSGAISQGNRINTGANQQPSSEQYNVEGQRGIAERSNIQTEVSSVAGTEKRDIKRRFQPTPPAGL